MNGFHLIQLHLWPHLTLRSVHPLVGMLTGSARPGLKLSARPTRVFQMPISMRKMMRSHRIFMDFPDDQPMRFGGSKF